MIVRVGGFGDMSDLVKKAVKEYKKKMSMSPNWEPSVFVKLLGFDYMPVGKGSFITAVFEVSAKDKEI